MEILTKATREFSDFSFSFNRHPISGDIVKKKNEEAIRQSVKTLLTTRRGERPFNPDLGSPIYDYLFENASVVDEFIIRSEVIKMLGAYEPRIIVNEVKVKFIPENHSLSVFVSANIVNTQSPIEISVLVDRLR